MSEVREQIKGNVVELLRELFEASVHANDSDRRATFERDIQGIEAWLTGEPDATRLRAVISRESDRGCALVAAEYLDARLEKLLRANFVMTRGADDVFRYPGMLSSFAAKVLLADLLGLLPLDAIRDLTMIRKIRNDFAHSSTEATFATENIANRCKELIHVALQPDAEGRARFIRAATGVAAIIDGSSNRAQRPVYPNSVHKQLSRHLPSQLANLILEGTGLRMDDTGEVVSEG